MASFREWARRGSALIWFSGGALALSILMISGLVGYIAVRGLGFFWPKPIVQVQTASGPVMGEITGYDEAHLDTPAKVQFRVANRDLFGQDYRWFSASELAQRQEPADAVLVERLEGGAFIGRIKDVRKDGQTVAEGAGALRLAHERLPEARTSRLKVLKLEKDEGGKLNAKLEKLRIEKRRAEAAGKSIAGLEQQEKALHDTFEGLQKQIDEVRATSQAMTLTLEAVDGQTKDLPLASTVRIVAANQIGLAGKVRVYLSRLWEFVADDPRESNTEGGIFPAIFGTVMMVLIMSIMVVPLGVIAALFLREYAKQGLMVRMVRVAVNNLAGVPSIVFGIFGLGFFVYTLGGSIDRIFFAETLPTPTFGTGGILWASLTLALLTVPVVIVATEEALASVQRSQREASLALGATKWQTTWKVVLPSAMPGILTGLVLAMARGAGEVAPLMLTGVVKLAPAMPLDGTFPFLHLDRKFMHLGFHIYDVGFQSPNSEAAKPMVFATALLLLLVVLVLNLAALRLRQKLRARMGSSAF